MKPARGKVYQNAIQLLPKPGALPTMKRPDRKSCRKTVARNGAGALRAREAVGVSLLQVGSGFEPDGVETIFVFKKLIKSGQGEGSIAPEMPARCGAAIARDHRLHHRTPYVGTMRVAGTESTPFKVTELVEHEERMIACAFEMAGVGSTWEMRDRI